jgi:CYTH domain-containing protein
MVVNVEIERKFLVVDFPPDFDPDAGIPIKQGYLSVADDTEVRIRQKGAWCFLTVKRGSGLSRAEVEIGLEPAQFESLWPATAGRRLEKTRHEVALGRQTAELDQFHGELEGLLTVEVEFDTEEAAAAFDPPSWFGREVTDEKGYANKRLATEGLP